MVGVHGAVKSCVLHDDRWHICFQGALFAAMIPAHAQIRILALGLQHETHESAVRIQLWPHDHGSPSIAERQSARIFNEDVTLL